MTLVHTLARISGAFVLLLSLLAPLHAQVADRETHAFALFELLEQRSISGSQPVAWDAIGWIGGDVNRLWIRTSGARNAVGGGGESAIDALFGRLVAPYWDALVGVRAETRDAGAVHRTRTSAVLSLEGLAPYWFDVEPSLLVSDRGDVSAELTTTYDLFLTQRLLLQPRLDLHAAAQAVPAFGVGSGLNDAAVGLRLRYEIRRELAPYIGIHWSRILSGTTDLARATGEEVIGASIVAGVRAWF